MKYAIRYHKLSREWLIFNIDDQFELIGMHRTEKEAVSHVKGLEERDRKRDQFSRRPLEHAA